ncbi:MAG: TSUP family transporter [Acidimicrobiia bacterium]
MSLEMVTFGAGAAMTAAVLVGAISQQVTGFGFAIVCSPVFALAVGAHDGVRLVNMLGVGMSAVSLMAWRREVSWRDVLGLLVPAMFGVACGAIVVRQLDNQVLMTVAGVLVLLAAAAIASGLRIARLRGGFGTSVAGATSGIMNVIGGVSGPAVAIYAINAGWPPTRFRATVQAYFLALNLASVVALGAVAPQSELTGSVLAAAAVGIVAGRRLGRSMSAERVRTAVLVLATVAGVAAIARGLA